jgi:hypothetical protein
MVVAGARRASDTPPPPAVARRQNRVRMPIRSASWLFASRVAEEARARTDLRLYRHAVLLPDAFWYTASAYTSVRLLSWFQWPAASPDSREYV